MILSIFPFAMSINAINQIPVPTTRFEFSRQSPAGTCLTVKKPITSFLSGSQHYIHIYLYTPKPFALIPEFAVVDIVMVTDSFAKSASSGFARYVSSGSVPFHPQ